MTTLILLYRDCRGIYVSSKRGTQEVLEMMRGRDPANTLNVKDLEQIKPQLQDELHTQMTSKFE